MTQVEKEILLRDLCMRLPHRVVMATGYGKGLLTSIRVNDSNEKLGINVDPALTRLFNVNEVKPYLFPLSSMTEEQKADCPIDETNLNIIISNLGCYGIIEIPWRLSFLFVDWCNKNHFDYRGLIPLNLANDATGKNIYNL